MRTTDEQILRLLRKDARMNLTTMSRKTGIPVSTIFDRVRHQQGKCIKRFTALIDFRELGFPVRASVYVKAEPRIRDDLRAYLMAHTRVNSLYRVNNGFDLAMDCIFRDIRESEDFLEELEHRFGALQKMVIHMIDELAVEKAWIETA